MTELTLYYGPYQNYFSDFNNQISKLLSNSNTIKRAHIFIKLDKFKYNVKYFFVHEFINIVKKSYIAQNSSSNEIQV
jgi:hypothetical protein